MTTTAWPTAHAYLTAVRKPDTAFRSADLRSANFLRDKYGAPMAIEGQRTVVFFTDGAVRPTAVRCFKRALPHGAERYSALRAYFTDHPVAAIVPAEWQQHGIVVDEKLWPIVCTERVKAPSLQSFVGAHISSPECLARLARN